MSHNKLESIRRNPSRRRLKRWLPDRRHTAPTHEEVEQATVYFLRAGGIIPRTVTLEKGARYVNETHALQDAMTSKIAKMIYGSSQAKGYQPTLTEDEI